MGKTKKIGRPKIEIDPEKVLALATYGCTNTEIADFYACNETTIRNRFSEYLLKGRTSGKIRLRQKQFDLAMNGNIQMLIWLGKQTLGQAEKQDFHVDGPIPVVISDKFLPKEKNGTNKPK